MATDSKTVHASDIELSESWLPLIIAHSFARLNAGAPGESSDGFRAFLKLMLLRIRGQLSEEILENALASFMQSRATSILRAPQADFDVQRLRAVFDSASSGQKVQASELPPVLAACINEGNRVLLQIAVDAKQASHAPASQSAAAERQVPQRSGSLRPPAQDAAASTPIPAPQVPKASTATAGDGIALRAPCFSSTTASWLLAADSAFFALDRRRRGVWGVDALLHAVCMGPWSRHCAREHPKWRSSMSASIGDAMALSLLDACRAAAVDMTTPPVAAALGGGRPTHRAITDTSWQRPPQQQY